jgi:hypothetical protein
MEHMWDPVNLTAIRRHRKTQVYPGLAPLLGNDPRPACLNLLLGCLQWRGYSGGVDWI